MDVNNHIKFTVFLIVTGILSCLIPEHAAMAQVAAAAQDITTVHPSLLPNGDNGTGFTDSVWIILLALGGFLYLVSNRSI